MAIIKGWKRRRLIRRFVRKLPNDLARRYGAGHHYTAGQVLATLKACGYGTLHHDYALAFAMDPDMAVEAIGDKDRVEYLRAEIGLLCFGGSVDFTAYGHGTNSSTNLADSFELPRGGGPVD